MQDKRTLQQNKALWKYFELLAQTLNDSGLDMKRTLKPSVEIPWSKNTVHTFLWIPIENAQLGKDSTTDLEIKEINLVYETLNRHLGEKFGLSVSFPSIETTLQDIEAERLARKEREKIFEDDYNKQQED